MYKSTTVLLLSPLFTFVTATPPACLLAAINKQPDPSDFKAICGTLESKVAGDLKEICTQEVLPDAIKAYEATCLSAAGVTISINSTESSSPTTGSGESNSTTSGSDGKGSGGANATGTSGSHGSGSGSGSGSGGSKGSPTGSSASGSATPGSGAGELVVPGLLGLVGVVGVVLL